MPQPELRSEKTRKLIGKIPGFYLHYGTVIIAVILIAALSAISFIPYSETHQFSFNSQNSLNSKIIATAYLDDKAINIITDKANSITIDNQNIHILDISTSKEYTICNNVPMRKISITIVIDTSTKTLASNNIINLTIHETKKNAIQRYLHKS